MPNHETFMRRAIDLSRAGMESGNGYPYGTVIVRNGEIVAEGFNMVVSTTDPTAHAEIVAIRNACRDLKSISLQGCAMYINGVPCCMCMGSILWSGIDRVYYALTMADSDAVGLGDAHFYAQMALPVEQRTPPFVQIPALHDAARAVLEDWRIRAQQQQPS